MAKRKHAAALFEVFNDKNKQAASRPAAVMRGTGWWFKGRQQSGAEPASEQIVDENDPTTMTIRSPLIAPRIAAVEAMPPVAPKPVVQKAVAPPKPATLSKPVAQPAPRHEPVAEADAIRQRLRAIVSDSSSRFHLDPDTREITLRLSLKAAIIAGFSLILSVGVAYVVGRHSGNSEAVAAAKLADAQRAAEVRSSALDLPRRVVHTQMPPPSSRLTPRMGGDDRSRDHEALPVANSVHGMSAVARPDQDASAVGRPDQADGERIIGLNYLLIQNYPNQASAAEARDFLVKNGISCTVEKVPAGFFCPDPAWMSVITTRGFDKEELHAPEFEAYKRQIEKLGDKFAGNGKFKRFSLQLYKLK